MTQKGGQGAIVLALTLLSMGAAPCKPQDSATGSGVTTTGNATPVPTLAAPVVVSINPGFGNINGGNLVTITGTGFQLGATVILGNAPCGSVFVFSATTLQCVTTIVGVVGPVTVIVTNPDFQSGYLFSAYTYTNVPSPFFSTISGSGPVVANGTASSTVQIVLKDSNGAAIAGAVPTFAATDSGSRNIYGPCSPSDGGGVSTCLLKSTGAETKLLTITSPPSVNGVTGGVVTFQAGSPSPTFTTITGTGPKKATGGIGAASTSVISITVRDDFNNPVPSVAPSFVATDTSGGNSYGICSASNSSGISTCTLRSTHAELKVLTVVTPVLKSDGFVTFNEDISSSLNSTMSATQPVLANSGAPSLVTIQLLDVAGNPVTPATFVGNPTFTASGSGNSIGACSPPNFSGQSFCTMTSTVAETKSLTLLSPVFKSNATTVQFIPGPTAAFNSDIFCTSNCTFQADGIDEATIQITLRDAGNNPVVGTVPTFSASDSDGTNSYRPCSVSANNGVSLCKLRTTSFGGGTFTKCLNITSPVTQVNGVVASCLNPHGQSSNVQYVQQPSPAAVTPTITNGPFTGKRGGGTPITITGTNFKPGTVVSMGGKRCTNVSVTGGTSITCNTPAWDPTTMPGGWSTATYDLIVTNTEGGTGLLTNGFKFVGYNYTGTIGTLSGVKNIQAGGGHTCGLMADGTLTCWGDNEFSQLGHDTGGSFSDDNTYLTQPVKVLNSGTIYVNIAAVSTGINHSCALMDSGSVHCWGKNTFAQVSGDSTKLDAIMENLNNYTTINGSSTGVAVGLEHSCQVSNTGIVSCWGRNHKGQLGQGTVADAATSKANITKANMNGLAIQVTAGAAHSCALLANHKVMCWGDNTFGQLGNGTFTNSSLPVGVWADSGGTHLTNVVSISAGAGGNHTCAVIVGGTVKCWGKNDFGQLGNGFFNNPTPVQVIGISTAKAVANGTVHSCALLVDGTVKCWGSNDRGQAPASPALGLLATQITAGDSHSCALVLGGFVECWGFNAQGQLGFTSAQDNTLPNFPQESGGVSGPTRAISIAGGGAVGGLDLTEVCALMSNNSINCWGSNQFGELGVNSASASLATPFPVVDSTGNVLRDFIAVSVGALHACGLKADGSMRCWGQNQRGQLGGGTVNVPTISRVPVDVNALGAGVVNMSTGGVGTCATLITGQAQCWGADDVGQLGDGSTGTDKAVPTTVVLGDPGAPPLNNVLNIEGGLNSYCALLGNGTVVCWGEGSTGELGNDATSDSSTPVTVVQKANVTAALPNVKSLNRGGSQSGHTCAILADGTAACWGVNANGQLGNGGTASPQQAPTLVVAGTGTATDLTQVSSNLVGSCARYSDGTARCWGDDSFGTLGDNPASATNAPVNVLGPNPLGGCSASQMTDVIQVTMAALDGCALRSDGNIYCWGLQLAGGRGDDFLADQTCAQLPVLLP